MLLLWLVAPRGTSAYYVDAAGLPVGVEDPRQLPERVERVRRWSFALGVSIIIVLRALMAIE
jgi:hypothetical protein